MVPNGRPPAGGAGGGRRPGGGWGGVSPKSEPAVKRRARFRDSTLIVYFRGG